MPGGNAESQKHGLAIAMLFTMFCVVFLLNFLYWTIACLHAHLRLLVLGGQKVGLYECSQDSYLVQYVVVRVAHVHTMLQLLFGMLMEKSIPYLVQA